jgi:hypothetical protein
MEVTQSKNWGHMTALATKGGNNSNQNLFAHWLKKVAKKYTKTTFGGRGKEKLMFRSDLKKL